MQILELLVQQLNTNLVHKAITLSVNDDAKKWISRRRWSTAATVPVPCAARSSATSRTRSQRRLIAGQIAQRPAFLEVYLGNDQLHYRPVAQEGDEQLEGAALSLA